MAKLKPDYIEWVLKLNATQAQEEYHKLEKANKELKKQNDENRKAMVQLEAQGKKGSEAWNNLRKSIAQNSREMSTNRAKMAEISKHMDTSTKTIAQLRKQLKTLKKEFENTSKAANPQRYEELRREIIRVQTAIDKANAATRGLSDSFFSLAKMRQIVTGFFFQIGVAVLALITGAFANAFNLIVDFEKANSRLASILRTTKEGIKDLTAAARQLGATTSYSAAEVTNLQIELAKLGFAKEQILQMEGAVLKFAKAVDTDLASASAFAGAALRIFNKDASETEDVLATFAVATTKTALDFSALETSLSIVGPAANSFGLSIEDTTALLGMLANAGFNASSAATATRNIILNLCDANGNLAKALGAPVNNVADLTKGLKKLRDEGVNLAKALELTDKESVSAFSTFLDQAGNITELRDSITGVTGAFTAMSETMGDNVAGAMAGLRSASEELVLKISSGTNGPIKDLIQALTTIVQKTGNLIEVLGRASGVIKVVVVSLVSYRAAVLVLTKAKVAWIALTKTASAVQAAFAVGVRAVTLSVRALSTGFTGLTKAIKVMRIALVSTPWGAALAALSAVVTAVIAFRSETEETVDALKVWNETSQEASRQIGEQRSKIESLILVAQNENIAMSQRLKAVAELNKIIPGYNASIDATTQKYQASTQALKDYLDQLEKEMRYKVYHDKLSELVAESEKKREALGQAQIEAEQERRREGTGSAMGFRIVDYSKRKAAKEAQKEFDEAMKLVDDFKARIEKNFESGILSLPGAKDAVEEEIEGVEESLDKTQSKIKTIDAEIKKLSKDLKNANDEEYKQISAQIEALREKKRVLLGKSKRTPGTYSEDDVAAVESPIKQAHNNRQLEIDSSKAAISSTEYAKRSAEELKRYYTELIEGYKTFAEKVPASHKATLDKIAEKTAEAQKGLLKATEQYNAALVAEQEKTHEDVMNVYKAAYEAETEVYRESMRKREMSQEAGNVLMMRRTIQFHNEQLSELRDYYADVQASDNMSVEAKEKALAKLAAEIKAKQSEILTETGKYAEAVRELMTDTDSAVGLENAHRLKLKMLEELYDAVLKDDKLSAEDREALETERLRRMAALNYQYQEQMWQLQEITGLTWGQEYERELQMLDNYHRQGLVKEQDYQKKKLLLAVNNAKRYYDYFGNLSSSAFSAIQQSEIDSSEAKYDVLIQQAKNNGEDTAALEEEKENKKLEIQKKYADLDFAVKISQIIANTAVSIMQAFAQLGPIGGAVAAAMLTATGAAQVVIAKAERDKIKNMQPGSTASKADAGASTPKATRVLKGFSEGGYTGKGDRFEVAGIVHKGEYVVPMPIMDHPRVIDAVGTIEAIRQNKRLATGAAPSPSEGFADGGFTGMPASSGNDPQAFSEAVKALNFAASRLRNLRAYVVLSDIEHAEDTAERARAPFTRNR